MIASAIVLLGATLIVVLRSYGAFGQDGIRPRLIASLGLWLVVVIGGWFAFHQQNFDFGRVGLFTFGWSQLAFGLMFGLLGLLAFPVYVLIARKLGGEPPKTDSLEVFASASLPQRLFLLITAAGAEEIIFRAIAIGGLIAAGFNHTLAVALPLAVFVLLHRSSWGVVHLLFVTWAGMLMTGAFLYGGLWAAVLAHLIVDAPMMLAAKAMSARANRHHNEEIGRD